MGTCVAFGWTNELYPDQRSVILYGHGPLWWLQFVHGQDVCRRSVRGNCCCSDAGGDAAVAGGRQDEEDRRAGSHGRVSGDKGGQGSVCHCCFLPENRRPGRTPRCRGRACRQGRRIPQGRHAPVRPCSPCPGKDPTINTSYSSKKK